MFARQANNRMAVEMGLSIKMAMSFYIGMFERLKKRFMFLSVAKDSQRYTSPAFISL